jgi:hypothetical protein
VELAAEVDQLQALQRELDGLEGWLSHRLSEPREPQCHIAWTAAELRELMLEQMRKEAEEAALRSRLASLPPPSPYSDADLQAMEAQHAALALWQERLRFERLHPGSPFSPDALSQMSADWLCLERHDELARWSIGSPMPIITTVPSVSTAGRPIPCLWPGSPSGGLSCWR